MDTSITELSGAVGDLVRRALAGGFTPTQEEMNAAIQADIDAGLVPVRAGGKETDTERGGGPGPEGGPDETHGAPGEGSEEQGQGAERGKDE